MSYVSKILEPGEELLAIGHMHWIVYLPGFFVGIIGAALYVWRMPEGVPQIFAQVAGALIIIFGLINLFSAWFEKWTTEIAVTDRRVIHKRGFIRRETGEMNMGKVESVIVDQSILGRILGYGSIVVRGTGAGIEGLHHIANPLAVRSAIVVR